jgi:hypothetical protein
MMTETLTESPAGRPPDDVMGIRAAMYLSGQSIFFVFTGVVATIHVMMAGLL